MQIKVSTIYVIQALREYQREGGTLSATEIARRLDISLAYSWKLNRILVRRGILRSIRGSQGGHMLAKDLSKTTIAELIERADGGLLPERRGETEDMSAIRRRLREGLTNKGWGKPVASLL